MKRVCESSADRITDLPAEVIQRILVFLPIKDAARTSALSRKWRHQWRSIRELYFDDEFAKIPEESESEWKLMNKQVMLNIYKSLLLHDGPVTTFELSVPGLGPCHEIDLILIYLSNKGVKHLTFWFTGGYVETDDYQTMHSSLFSAFHLKSLKLQCCLLTPPSWFGGFSKLTRLHLEYVDLPCDFFDDFIPKFPMLQYLRSVYCEGPGGKLEIVAPILKSFTFVGDYVGIYFKSTPLLSDVTLALTLCDTPDMASLFASLPALQQFYVEYDTSELLVAGVVNVPTRLPTYLLGLKVLNLRDFLFDSSEMERVFVCLIRSSPNLRRLTVQLSSSQLEFQPSNSEITSIQRLLEAEVCPGSSDCLQHLRNFRIEDSLGTQVELDLARFVLATAALLRIIHITPCYGLDSKKITKFMKEVMRYKRISKEAEIIYNWKDKED